MIASLPVSVSNFLSPGSVCLLFVSLWRSSYGLLVQPHFMPFKGEETVDKVLFLVLNDSIPLGFLLGYAASFLSSHQFELTYMTPYCSFMLFPRDWGWICWWDDRQGSVICSAVRPVTQHLIWTSELLSGDADSLSDTSVSWGLITRPPCIMTPCSGF